MSCDQNLRQLRMNVISRFTIYINREVREWQFSLFFIVVSEKSANFCIISREIAKITGKGYEHNFMIYIRTEVKRDSVKC